MQIVTTRVAQAFALPILQVVHESLRAVAGTGASTSTSTSSAAASEPVRLSDEDRDAVFNIREDGLRCQSRAERSWGGARATVGAFAGRVYYEVRMLTISACFEQPANEHIVGCCNAADALVYCLSVVGGAQSSAADHFSSQLIAGLMCL